MKTSRNYLIQILIISFIFSLFSSAISQEVKSLSENETIKTYIIKDVKHSYHLSLDNPNDIKKILIDLMIFSGDVIINFNEKNDNIHKYETANKIFFSITTSNIDNIDLYNLDFQVIAFKNSYYSIRFTTIKKNEEESEVANIIPSNTNFLLTTYPYNDENEFNFFSRKFTFKNENSNNQPFVISFYSLNCEYKFFKINNDGSTTRLKSKDNYFAQDLFKPGDDEYEKKEYTYITEFISIEQGTYNKKMCMIYASSTQLDENILIGENVPQKIIFNSGGLTKIKYLYQLPEKKNDLAIKFLLNNRAEYNVNFYIENEIIKTSKISNNQQEIIESKTYSNYCYKNQECKLTVEIILTNSKEENKDLELEVTIKSISLTEKYPSYLVKNKINSEYLNYISPNYYYTDLGEQLSGDIIINYYRGNGMVFGKIVKYNQAPEANPEWRGIYEFPSTINGTLKYTSYLKKLSFSEEDTKDCGNKCYLLLSVVNNLTSASDDYDYISSRYFGFDILIVTNSILISAWAAIIPLPFDKYVIGSISKEESSPDYKRYYIINIPYDAEKVIFDLQSEDAAMYINLYFKDDERFTDAKYPSSKTKHNWEVLSKGKPQLFEIKKEQIIQEANNQIDSLNEVSLTICIEAQSMNNKLSTIYALKYHLQLNAKLDIYEIYSDQQTICKSQNIDNTNKYKCLYLVKYDKNDIKYSLLLNPLLENQSTDFRIYADFIPKEIYDLYDQDKLEQLIPKNTAEFSTEKIKENFLYINLQGREDKYLYITIETDESTNMRLLSTFSTFDYSSSPNPSTSQLYIITNNEMKFSFIYTQDIVINIVSVLGGADIFWEDEESKGVIHRLGGRDDRLSLTSPPIKEDFKSKYNSIIIRNRHISSYDESQIPGGFIFYLTFYLRPDMVNFDEIGFGKSFNFNYRDTDFPLSVYFKMDSIKKDTNAFVTIYSMEGAKRVFSDEKEFVVYSTILSDNTIYKIRSDPEIDIKQESLIEGIYDPSKRVCLISLKSTDMSKFQVSENDNPYLVIRIKHPFDVNTDSYNRISIEGTVIQDNSLIPVTEKVYQHGKLKKGSENIVYKLSTNQAQNIMFIVFSSNSNLLDFKISTDNTNNINNIDNTDNDIIDEFNKNKYTSNGRYITYIHTKPEKNNYIYLTIFKKDKNNENENLTNYVFKYINVDDISKVKFYNVKDTNIIHSIKDDSSHYIAVDYIGCENCEVIYYINFIPRSSLIEGENFDNIAVIQSYGITREVENKNLKVVDNKVNMIINNTYGILDKDFAYIQVIAHVNEEPINEYIAFKSLFLEKKEEPKPEEQTPQTPQTPQKTENGTDTKLIVTISVVSVLFVAVVVTLIIVVVRFNIKNKDLLEQVNAISFQQDRILSNTNEEDEDNKSNLLLS